MQVSVIGRVNNTHLALNQGLLPVYEAIINSIHAIEDASSGNGHIIVKIKRTLDQELIDDENNRSRIIEFEIVDNGIGFTNENFVSFTTSDSQLKAERGGRGVGRFMWLKAFGLVEINSVFREEGVLKRRRFNFKYTKEGIESLELDTVDEGPVQTSVRLIGFKEEYSSRVPIHASTIAQRIVEHCLEYFVLDKAPSIFLEDTEEEANIILNDVYDELVAKSQVEDVSVAGQAFRLTHFMLQASTGMAHRLNFCANHRVVKGQRLVNRIPDLTPSVPSLEDSTPLIYAGYLSSAYLDSHVNPERTDFNSLVEEGGLNFPGELAWSDIEDSATSAVKIFLQPYTDPIREEKERRILEYVESVAPQYRPLIKHRNDRLEEIPAGLNHEKLDLELYRIDREYDYELRREASELLSQTSETENFKSLHEHYARFLEEWNEKGKARLATYIVHRRVTLDLLAKLLKRRDDGKYELEEAVHETIFPLRSTSADISYEQQNLWIIDEKLAYHRYLASDLPMKKIDVLDSNDMDRPDLVIFDRPIAIVEDEAPFSSVVVFEFKRPMRDDYKADHNPIEQVLRYVQKLRSGTALDRNGRPVTILDSIPFYCYVVCDMTSKLKDQAQLAGLQETPDKEGYFGYNPNYLAYIEVISFDKLVRDAKQRNAILFEKLGIPPNYTAQMS